MIKAPCKNCAKREPGCHGRCEEYLDYKKKHQEAWQRERDMRACFHPEYYSYAPYSPRRREKRGNDKDIDERD